MRDDDKPGEARHLGRHDALSRGPLAMGMMPDLYCSTESVINTLNRAFCFSRNLFLPRIKNKRFFQYTCLMSVVVI